MSESGSERVEAHVASALFFDAAAHPFALNPSDRIVLKVKLNFCPAPSAVPPVLGGGLRLAPGHHMGVGVRFVSAQLVCMVVLIGYRRDLACPARPGRACEFEVAPPPVRQAGRAALPAGEEAFRQSAEAVQWLLHVAFRESSYSGRELVSKWRRESRKSRRCRK